MATLRLERPRIALCKKCNRTFSTTSSDPRCSDKYCKSSKVFDNETGVRYREWIKQAKMLDPDLFDWSGAGLENPMGDPLAEVEDTEEPDMVEADKGTEEDLTIDDKLVDDTIKEKAPTEPQKETISRESVSSAKRSIKKVFSLGTGILFRFIDWRPLDEEELDDITRATYNVFGGKKSASKITKVLEKAPIADFAITGGEIVYNRISERDRTEHEEQKVEETKEEAIRKGKVPLSPKS